jgi:hypothetical protein
MIPLKQNVGKKSMWQFGEAGLALALHGPVWCSPVRHIIYGFKTSAKFKGKNLILHLSKYNNVMKGTEYFVWLYMSVVLTKQCNDMVNGAELLPQNMYYGQDYNHPPSSPVVSHVLVPRNLVLVAQRQFNKQMYTINVLYIVSPNYYSWRLFVFMDATSKIYALLVTE